MKRADTKGRIVAAAWRLFYEQGYENTTVEEIIDNINFLIKKYIYYYK